MFELYTMASVSFFYVCILLLSPLQQYFWLSWIAFHFLFCFYFFYLFIAPYLLFIIPCLLYYVWASQHSAAIRLIWAILVGGSKKVFTNLQLPTLHSLILERIIINFFPSFHFLISLFFLEK